MSNNGNSGALEDGQQKPLAVQNAAGAAAKRTGPLVLLGMVVAVSLTAGAFFLLKSAAVKPPLAPMVQPTP